MKSFERRSPTRRHARRATPRRMVPKLLPLEPRQMLTVTYHGGPVLTNVEVQALYYGSDWYNNSTDYGQTANWIHS